MYDAFSRTNTYMHTNIYIHTLKHTSFTECMNICERTANTRPFSSPPFSKILVIVVAARLDYFGYIGPCSENHLADKIHIHTHSGLCIYSPKRGGCDCLLHSDSRPARPPNENDARATNDMEIRTRYLFCLSSQRRTNQLHIRRILSRPSTSHRCAMAQPRTAIVSQNTVAMRC